MKRIQLTGILCLTILTTFGQKSYYGAEIYTADDYKYGRMEFRMRASSGEGLVNAFFTYKNGSE